MSTEKIVKTGKLNERRTVYITDKIAGKDRNAHRNVGDPVSLHPVQAEKWIETGKATAEQSAGAAKTKGGKA